MIASHNTTRWLRIEGAAVLVLSILLYARSGSSWVLFGILFLVPDLSMLGYLQSPQLGAITYNVVHTYAASLALGAIGLMLDDPVVMAAALIWTAHIGLDRALGFGLKRPSGFKDTHLGSMR